MTDVSQSVLAVDGGQSTVRVRHSNGATGEAAGVSWGRPDTVAATSDAIMTAWWAAGAPPTDVAVLGLTTVPEDSTARAQLAAHIAEATGSSRVLICDDGVTAHAGALEGSWGVMMAIGTGVACVARARSGVTTFVGGHGYLIGDEGGAFWIGRAGIAAALRAVDGRGAATELSRVVRSAFGELNSAHIRIHAHPRAVDHIAQFAPVVIATARAGDALARGILNTALAELTASARAAWSAAGGSLATPLAVSGRLADQLRPELDDALIGLGDIITQQRPAGDALDGALHLARDASGYATAVYVWTKG